MGRQVKLSKTLQEEHSLLTGPQIVLQKLHIDIFIKVQSEFSAQSSTKNVLIDNRN